MTLSRWTIVLAILVLISCNKSPTADNQEREKSAPGQDNVVERTITDHYEFEIDTTIESLGLRIIISERSLDSFVVNEYTSENIKHIDKYPDIERSLKILQDDNVLMDTILTKENLGVGLDKEFLTISNFHGYWINAVREDGIDFFGVIAKPETDWAFAFYHYFDTKTRTFTIKEEIDDEI